MHVISNFVAQISDYGPAIGQFGFGGVTLWIVNSRLTALEHTMKGLSKAMWMDLAQRSGPGFIQEEARRMLAKMEQQK